MSGARFVNFASVELDSDQLYTDILLELIMNGKRILLHVEFQRSRDAKMRERVWEYNVRATLKYGCPVWSCVIYLKKENVVAQAFLRRELPNGRAIHHFDFEVIKLWEIPMQVLKQKGLKGLLPLLPLAKDGARREVVEEVIAELAPAGEEPRGELLTLAYGFASLAFEEEADQNWLVGRFSMLYDILRETRAFKELAKEGQLESLRQALFNFLQARFPDSKIIRLAKGQVAKVDDPEVLQQMLLNVSLAQTREEVLERLLDWPETDTDEHSTV